MNRLFFCAAAFAMLTVGGALPSQAAVLPAGSTIAALGSDFATSLTGAIPGKGRTLRLDVRRSGDDKSVQLALTIRNAAGTSGSDFTFGVPASDLVLGSGSAGLDTHQHLGRYGTISVRWTYGAPPAQITLPADPCLGTAATSVTRAVAGASGRLALALPGEGSVDVPLGSAGLALDSGYNVRLPESNDLPDRRIYYTSVSATKSLGAGKSLLVTAINTGRTARITFTLRSSGAASTGLISSSHFATDSLPLAGLTTGTGKAGQPATTLTYKGALGSAGLAFTGSGEPMVASDKGRCVNPNAAAADLGKTVGEQLARAAVEGSVSLSATAASGVLRATFGNGDLGMVAVYGPTTAAAGVPSATGTGLPVFGRGDVPGIRQIGPAPGGELSAARAITVTFAHPLPAHAYLVVMLEGPGGAVPLSDPVLHGNAATVTLTSPAALEPGRYTLEVSATSRSGGQVFYDGTYVVSARLSAGGTPVARGTALPGVIVTGDFPPVVGMSPEPGSTITTRTPTFVVTLRSRPAADASFHVVCGPSDSKGNPTGMVQLSDPVVQGNTVTASVLSSSALSPGRYVFIIQGGDGGGLLEFRAMYTVK